MFYRNFRNPRKRARDQGLYWMLLQGMDKTPNTQAVQRRGAGTQMWGVTAWFRRALCSLPWFYSILCRTTHKEQGWPLEVTLSKHLIKVTKLIFSGLCGSLGLKYHLLLPLDDDTSELKLSSSGFNTSPVLFQNWCFDSYQPFPLEALRPLFLLKCKSLDGDLQDVQRTHVVKISLLFLPKRSFSLWQDNSFLWWSHTGVFINQLPVGLNFGH